MTRTEEAPAQESSIGRARALPPDVRELEIAHQRAAFAEFERASHAADRAERKAREALEASDVFLFHVLACEAQASASQCVRTCGQWLMELERAHGLHDDYTNGESHVKVGT